MGVTAAVAAITAGIVALATAAANDAVPSVKELTEAARGMREAMDEAKATYDDTVTSTMAAAGVADTYIGKLEEMEAAGLNTDEQHRQYHNTLALLCQVVPELADYIDLETDTINGGTEALRANTEAWKQNAMQQAYQDQLTELYSQYSAVLIEAEENSIGLTKAQYSLEAAQQKLSDTYAQMDALWADAQKQADAYYDQYGYYTDATAFLSQEYYDLQNSIYDTNNEIWAAEKSIKNYNKAMEDDADAVSDAEAEIALAEEAVKNLTASMNEGTGASEEAAAQVSEFQAAISGVQEKINALKEQFESQDTGCDDIDLTRSAYPVELGTRHPLTIVKNEIIDIFARLGFSIAEGPEIEDDWHVFSALNFAEDHPARDMQDTFFIEAHPDIVLRTHTSSVQTRVMEVSQPPIRIICPGRVYRNEAISYRAHCFFHQVEALYVDKDVSFTDLKQVLLLFAKEMFGEETKIRLRPSYFPFTEPSAEMDISCNICGGKGCPFCKHTGWVEILGCGMVDPNVLESNGIDSKIYSGYALGMGIERITNLKYQVKDLRMFSENDTRFLKEFEAAY